SAQQVILNSNQDLYPLLVCSGGAGGCPGGPGCACSQNSDCQSGNCGSDIGGNQIGNVSVGFVGVENHWCGGTCNVPVIESICNAIISAAVGDLQNTLRDQLSGALNDGAPHTIVANSLQDALVNVNITGPLSDALGVSFQTPFHKPAPPNGIRGD